MKLYELLILSTLCWVISGCAAREPANETILQMRELQRKLNIAELFSQDKLFYQGVFAYKKIEKFPKVQHVAFYTEKGIIHGPSRYIDSDGVPFIDSFYSQGRLTEYYYIKGKDRTYCLIFKNGKPWNGNLFLPWYNREVEFKEREMEFKNGMLLRLYEHEDGQKTKVLIDCSKNEFRDKRPWNGFFMAEEENILSFYRNGKKVVEPENAELLTFVNIILKRITASP